MLTVCHSVDVVWSQPQDNGVILNLGLDPIRTLSQFRFIEVDITVFVSRVWCAHIQLFIEL